MRGGISAGLFDVNKNAVVVVAHFEKAHVWGLQGDPKQRFEHRQITGDNPVLGGWSQLAGDQLARLLELQLQFLKLIL